MEIISHKKGSTYLIKNQHDTSFYVIHNLTCVAWHQEPTTML